MANERLQKWTLAAELISGIAVLVTIIILVFEIRSNTTAIKRSSYDGVIEGLVEWRQTAIMDEQLNRIFTAPRGVELTDQEQATLDLWLQSLYLIHERAFWAYEYGQMGEAEWDRFERNICGSIPRRFDTNLKQFLSLPFSDFVESCPNYE